MKNITWHSSNSSSSSRQQQQSLEDPQMEGFIYDEHLLGFMKHQTIFMAFNPYQLHIGYRDISSWNYQQNIDKSTKILGSNILFINKYWYSTMTAFYYSPDSLVYEFENNIKLTLMRTQSNTIIYNLKTPKINVTVPLDIDMNSSTSSRKFLSISNTKCSEFDKLLEFCRTSITLSMPVPSAPYIEPPTALAQQIY